MVTKAQKDAEQAKAAEEFQTPQASQEEKEPTIERAMRFKRTRIIAQPLWKWLPDEPKFMEIKQAIFLGKDIKQVKGGKKMEPAHLMGVVNMETGENMQVIVGTVLKSTLEEDFPDETYVGKCFEIIQNKGTRAYKTYSIYEIEMIEITHDDD